MLTRERKKQVKDYDATLGLSGYNSMPKYMDILLPKEFSQEKDIDDVLTNNRLDTLDKLRHCNQEEIYNLKDAKGKTIRPEAALKLIGTIYEQSGWLLEDHKDPLFIKQQITDKKLKTIAGSFTLSAMQKDKIMRRAVSNRDYDIGFKTRTLPDYLKADISFYFDDKFPVYKLLKIAGINTLNDFRLFNLDELAALTVDGNDKKSDRLFTGPQIEKIKRDVHKNGGFFFKDQEPHSDIDVAAYIAKGKANYSPEKSASTPATDGAKIIPINILAMKAAFIANLAQQPETDSANNSQFELPANLAPYLPEILETFKENHITVHLQINKPANHLKNAVNY